MVAFSKLVRSAPWLAVIVLLIVPAPCAFAEGDAAEPTVALRWAVAARETPDAQAVAITSDTTLAAGSRLKLLIEPLSAGVFYVILLDSSDELQILYRSAPARETERTYIPTGKQWFELPEEPGRETFFLLASAELLTDLETLLDEFSAAAGKGTSQQDLQTEIVSEIRRQHRQHRRFSRPVEKPVLIGGQTRGGAGIDHLAVETHAGRFYGKTITIDR